MHGLSGRVASGIGITVAMQAMSSLDQLQPVEDMGPVGEVRLVPDPDTFRIDRDPNPHVGFGIGTHYCLGANLARAEISVVFEQLFQRLHDIHVPDGVVPPRGENTLVIARRCITIMYAAIGLVLVTTSETVKRAKQARAAARAEAPAPAEHALPIAPLAVAEKSE